MLGHAVTIGYYKTIGNYFGGAKKALPPQVVSPR